MIVELIKHDYAAIWIKLFIVCGAWAAVLLAMVIDLGFGIKKAKQLGEQRSSEGYRRSIHKFVYYFAMLFFALMFDALNPLSFYLPFPLAVMPVITLLCALALIFTEWKSVREKAEDKLRRRTDATFRDILEVLEKKEDGFVKILEFMKTEKEKQDEKNNLPAN
ncbi:phage holin family protein [Epilithonimonas pallida]|uniref:Bacteriophage holin family protein n=1 Tax=Epilithonimonas pallida TaxID=373671 RepID=A0ABY1R4C8_9FLAO|nr:phage holin family protein [Epilithonimonas pallida]SMP94685.1 Bacteriophage holin family protein [Epilithonimonas pallida]